MLKLTCLIFIVVTVSNCNSHKSLNQTTENTNDSLSNSWDTASNPLYWKYKSANNPVIFLPHFSLVKTDTLPINISFFETIPETISTNMGEFYTYDTTKINEHKYIFLSTLTKYAVIKVNDKETYLDKKYDECVSVSNQITKDVYYGNGFKIIITHKLVEVNNGVSNETGTLEIFNSKYRVTYKVHGGYKMP